MDRLQSPQMDQLIDAILFLQSREECYRFFEDLATVAELQAMAQRFDVARKLDSGEIYSQVVEETGASTATISRVKRALHYGADGYRLVLDRMKGEEVPP